MGSGRRLWPWCLLGVLAVLIIAVAGAVFVILPSVPDPTVRLIITFTWGLLLGYGIASPLLAVALDDWISRRG